MDLSTSLVYARQWPIVGRLAYYVLKLLGVEIPCTVKVGRDFELAHGGFGVVVHSRTTIGDRVKLYPGVGLGRADIYQPMERSRFEGIMIEDDVILAPGAKVLCKEGVLRVRRGTVLGANAVLLQSTGEWEIWAGVPAKRVGRRDESMNQRVSVSANQRVSESPDQQGSPR
jgi:serine O-acetyltransferase